MANVAARLDRALRAAGLQILGVSIGDRTDRRTWMVHPVTLQAEAQPLIDAFTADAPEVVEAERDAFAVANAASPLVQAMVIFHERERFKDANGRYPTLPELGPLLTEARIQFRTILKAQL